MARCPLALCLLACLPPASGAEITLLPTQDASIYGGVPGYDNVADGSGTYLWTSVTAAGVARRALLRFDLSTIPAGAQVQAAQLSVYLSRLQAADPQVRLHRINAPWTEGPANSGSQGHGAAATAGDVTWVNRSHPSLPWGQPGGDIDAQPSASVNLGLSGEYQVWGPTARMVADVQGWVSNSASNHGWMLIGIETGSQNAKRFESRESTPSVRPRLRVVYEPASQVSVDDIPVPGWALGLLGVALMGTLARRRRAGPTMVRMDASERMPGPRSKTRP